MLRIVAIALLVLANPLRAHQIAEMTFRIEAEGERFQATCELDAAYMLPEYRGDEDVAGQDLAWLRSLSPQEWQRIRGESETYLRQCLEIRTEAGPCQWQMSFPDFDRNPPSFMHEGIAEMPPMIEARIEGSYVGRDLSIRWSEPFGVVLIVQAGDETIPIISTYEETVLHREPDDIINPETPSIGQWILLGFRHIVPDGLDHMLFILGIFLLLPKWKPLVSQSLIFTLAHSMTLGLAAAGWVQLPEKWVEIAIAASIAWIGIENLWAKQAGPGRYALIAVFGLIHGLGFASQLTPLLPVGRPDALLFGIAGFNLGVELGQILVLALAFACCGWWKPEAFSKVKISGSAIVALAGLIMMITRS